MKSTRSTNMKLIPPRLLQRSIPPTSGLLSRPRARVERDPPAKTNTRRHIPSLKRSIMLLASISLRILQDSSIAFLTVLTTPPRSKSSTTLNTAISAMRTPLLSICRKFGIMKPMFSPKRHMRRSSLTRSSKMRDCMSKERRLRLR